MDQHQAIKADAAHTTSPDVVESPAAATPTPPKDNDSLPADHKPRVTRHVRRPFEKNRLRTLARTFDRGHKINFSWSLPKEKDNDEIDNGEAPWHHYECVVTNVRPLTLKCDEVITDAADATVAVAGTKQNEDHDHHDEDEDPSNDQEENAPNEAPNRVLNPVGEIEFLKFIQTVTIWKLNIDRPPLPKLPDTC
eukprot:PhM_4_TR15701/c0_g1_i2/m.85027